MMGEDLYWRLSETEWLRFNELLDAPARDLPKLRKLMERKAPWDEDEE